MPDLVSRSFKPFFKTLIVRDVLDEKVYDELVNSIPSSEQFAAQAKDKDVQPMLALREGSFSSFPAEVQEQWVQRYELFAGIDEMVMDHFAVMLDLYLDALMQEGVILSEKPQIKLGSAVLNDRTEGWHLFGHLHALNQLLQCMIYMPHPSSPIDDGTVVYKTKKPLQAASHDLFVNGSDQFSDKGSFGAVVHFRPEDVEPIASFPYSPNTLVAWINTPAAIHGTPMFQHTRRRRYSFSCCVMDRVPKVGDLYISLN